MPIINSRPSRNAWTILKKYFRCWAKNQKLVLTEQLLLLRVGERHVPKRPANGGVDWGRPEGLRYANGLRCYALAPPVEDVQEVWAGELTLKVDGKLVAEVIADDPAHFDAAGILGLQLHSGPPTVAQFKDVRLKQDK